MRRTALVFTGVSVLVFSAHTLAAQQKTPWSVTLATSLAGFRGAAADTSASVPIAVRPSQGITLGVAVTRRWGAWGVAAGVSYLPTHVEAVSNEIAVQERTTALERVRLMIAIARRLARLGNGELELRLGPTVDSWSTDEDRRTVMGGEGTLALSLPAGPVVIENTLGVGWSEGPFHADELPAGYRRQALRAINAGIGIRFKL